MKFQGVKLIHRDRVSEEPEAFLICTRVGTGGPCTPGDAQNEKAQAREHIVRRLRFFQVPLRTDRDATT
jgi:hypothetical protein